MAFIKDFECFACGSTLGKWNPGREGQHGEGRCFVCNACRGDVMLLHEEVKDLDYFSLCRIAGIEHGRVEDIITRLHTPGSHLSARRARAAIYLQEGLEVALEDLSDKAIEDLKELFGEYRERK